MLMSNFFSCWMCKCQHVGVTKKIFFSCWGGVHQTCRCPIFFVCGAQVSTCWCNKKNIFFMLGRCAPNMLVSNFFSCWMCECQHVGVTKKYFFHVGEVCTKHVGVQLLSSVVSKFQHVGVTKNIFFSCWRGAHQTCRHPTFLHLVYECQHVGVTKKYFFHVGEVCTKRAGVQLFIHLVSKCRHVGVPKKYFFLHVGCHPSVNMHWCNKKHFLFIFSIRWTTPNHVNVQLFFMLDS